MTNVCQIFPHYYPVLAGAAERFRRYAPGLKTRGINIAVCTAKSSKSLLDFELVDGIIPVTRFETSDEPKERDFLLFKKISDNFRNGKLSPSIVQTIKSDRRTLKSLIKIKRLGNALVFVSTMVENERWGRTIVHKVFNTCIQSFSQRLFDSIVVGSTAMAEAQLKFGANRSQIKIISHGVDTNRFKPSNVKSKLKEELRLPSDSKICLFVGNLIPRKGVHTIIDAWSHVGDPKAYLVLVGALDRPTISSQREQLEVEAYQHKVIHSIRENSRILYVGEQPYVEKWYQVADLFLFPSVQEGFPNALLEAMSSGLPCLTNLFQGFPDKELGESRKTFQLVSQLQEDWIETISSFLLNVNLRMEMGLAARNLMVSKHELSKTLDSYADLYRSCEN